VLRFLARSGDSLFFWSAGDGCIERLALAPSSTPVRVVCGNSPRSQIASDEAKIYWSTDDCAIMTASR